MQTLGLDAITCGAGQTVSPDTTLCYKAPVRRLCSNMRCAAEKQLASMPSTVGTDPNTRARVSCTPSWPSPYPTRFAAIMICTRGCGTYGRRSITIATTAACCDAQAIRG
jgi:hypothetical protein